MLEAIEGHDERQLQVNNPRPNKDGKYGPYPLNYCKNVGDAKCDITLIEIVDPCNNPFSLSAEGVTVPAPF